jgi:hemolysin III
MQDKIYGQETPKIDGDLGFDPDEENLHFITHLLGVIFILFFGHLLWMSSQMSTSLQIGVGIYLTTFFLVFFASAIYHHHFFKTRRRQLRKLDHIAIYFFIAGSNTPYLLGYSQEIEGLGFLITMWGLVFFGTVIKWLELRIPDWISLLYYLFMGWLGIVTMYLIFSELKTSAFILIIIGGLLYSIGAYFYKKDYIKWYHSIWHVFVLFAAISHFAAIYLQIF